jgi:HSP20 family protein
VDLFGWPWPQDGRAFVERLFGLSGDMIRVEEHTEGDTEVIRAEAPGIDPDKDVEITVEDGLLALHVERREQSREKVGEGYHSEFRYGSLSRTVPLPSGAKEDQVSATYTDGILEIRVPLAPAETAKPASRTIKVQHG